jgi:hypothetical protein
VSSKNISSKTKRPEETSKRDVLKSQEGQKILAIIQANFDLCFKCSPEHVKRAIHQGPCLLGSQIQVENLVYQILKAGTK